MIKVSRSKLSAYCYLPWAEVIHAAEDHLDGLESRGPHFTPMRDGPPRSDNFAADQQDRFKKELAKYESDQNCAFLREGDSDGWGKGKTLLYQQNW